jgi:hypothetical protein
MTSLEFHRRTVLGCQLLQLCGVIGVQWTAGQAIGMQQGNMATVSPLQIEQAATRTQIKSPVKIEKIGLVSQAPSPRHFHRTAARRMSSNAAGNGSSLAHADGSRKHILRLTWCVAVLRMKSSKGACSMHGCRDYVAACCRGTTLAALMMVAPFVSHAQTHPPGSNDPPAPMRPTPSLGVHTLLTQPEGLGISPAVTQAIDTQASGSSLIVFNGGYTSNQATPEDSYSNRWKQVGNVPFGNGYGDRFNVKAYVALSAKGGPGHTISVTKEGYAAGEISLPFIEIRQAGVLKDVAQNYPQPGLRMTSGSVTTTGPATLIAVWWGDGGIKRMTAVPDSGFTVIDSFLMLPDESGVQCAVAFRQVSAPGTYNLSWIGAPVQGAILWLFAFQSK